MKKLISIILLSLFLVCTTELYQLLKIPTLVEHYFEHKELNPEMSLVAFLKTHYQHPAKDGDYGKDQKLPFVMHSQPLVLVFTVNQNFNFEIKKDFLNPLKSPKIPSKDEDFCYKGFAGSVWEPPRILFA
ncbi:hypothetical protein [Chryseobacterium sp. MMS23-Vi53]|uniref:hypothetical protein n=1 Tax=Chryseobacterium sp. MMS23-Vi53 TaxID=3386644 RepID=UPI0039EBADD3